MRNIVKALLELATEQLMYYPCILVFAVHLFLDFSLPSALLVLSSILSSFFMRIAIQLGYEKNIDFQLLSTLTTFSDYQFTPTNLREIIDRYATYDEIQSQLYQNNITEIGEALIAKKVDYSGNRFSGFKAFPRIFSPNVVILPEGTGNYTYVQQFQLFHELGHLGKAHKKVAVFGNHIIAGLLATLLLCITLFPWYINLALLLPIRIWHFSCFSLSLIYGQEGGECEKLADSFAIKTLLHHPDFPKLERLLTRVDAEMAKRWQESIEYYKEWFESPVDMQRGRDFLLKHIHSDGMKFVVQKGLSDDAVNYNSMVERQCFPRNYLFAYILCGLYISGTVFGHINGWQFWTLLILPLAVSLSLCFLNVRKTAIINTAINRIIAGENINLDQLPKQKKCELLWKNIKLSLGKFLTSSEENRGFILRKKRK